MERRERIGLWVTGILNGFWSAEGVPAAVRAVELEGWLDVLDGCTDGELRAAWADYQKTGPRSGRGALYRPDAGAIWQRVVEVRRKAAPRPVALPEPPRGERVSARRAAELLREVGFRVNRFGGVDGG